MTALRPAAELRDTGLLWLINRVVFHPRGLALGINDAGEWCLLGDGSEAWYFTNDVDDDYFERAERTLAEARR